MINKKLLSRTLAFIEKYPDKHDQRTWCGTAQCFAGWACYLDGWRRTEDTVEIDDADCPLDNRDRSDVVAKETTAGSVESVAVSILGLLMSDADLLFNSDNHIDDLRDIVKDLCK